MSFINSLLSWMFWPLIIFFVLGLYMLLEVLLVSDKIVKQKTNEPNPRLLIFLWVIISAIFWVFVFHYTTSRWMMGFAPAIFIIVAYGVEKAYSILFIFISFITKNKNIVKVIATIIILALFSYGLYLEYKTADSFIKAKASSYDQVKDISLWLKQNTNKSDSIIFDSRIWYTYYVERNNSKPTSWWILPPNYEYKNMSYLLKEVPYGYVPMCEYDFDFTLNRTNQDYLVWTVYEQVYTASPAYLQKNIQEGIFVPVKPYYIGEQISGIVLKIDKQKLQSKLTSYNYADQIIPATVQETQTAWDSYKKQTGITEKQICSR